MVEKREMGERGLGRRLVNVIRKTEFSKARLIQGIKLYNGESVEEGTKKCIEIFELFSKADGQ